MIKYIKGDLLQTDAPLILHQVNLQGVMGGGLAYSIAHKYPSVEREYNAYKGALGDVLYSETDDFIIGNCYSQNEDFTTNYEALETCLMNVRWYAVKHNINVIAIPYKYGCGIAKGNWVTVAQVVNDILGNFEILIYMLGE